MNKRVRCTLLRAACVCVLLAAHATGAAAAEGIDFVLLVDSTGTMRFDSRAEGTLEGLKTFISEMQEGDRLSVFSYGERVVPILENYPVLISDSRVKDRLKDQLRFAFTADRTDITAGLERVWKERDRLFPSLQTDGERAGPRAAVILMTDGKLVPVYKDWAHYEQVYARSSSSLRNLVSKFGRETIPVHVIAVGSARKVSSDLTRHIAEASGGVYRHVEEASQVAGTYSDVMDVVALTREPVRGPSLALLDTADAAETRTSGRGASYRRSASMAQYIPEGLLERYAALLSVFVGAVAIGVDRRKPWAKHFVTCVGKAGVRVRGYLRPVDAPGTSSARPIIGIENPGLPTVKVGRNTPYARHARETIVEFIGTKDGTPPEIVVEKGRVLVGGKEVTGRRKLQNGEILDIEGVRYRYLRGNRK